MNKKDLITKFEDLDNKIVEIAEKYSAKIEELDKKLINTSEEFDESQEFDEDEDFLKEIEEFDNEEFTTEQMMQDFITSYEEDFQQRDLESVLKVVDEQFKEDLKSIQSDTEKELFETVNKLEIEISKTENEMYHIAKEFFKK